ncbi:unnamed protein product [Protopolystoma xenopodis]|uniref:Uncharacterized protein n=1 Tax=Protopolystoma xenopodis TaxID=117903 RepID=A0A3S5CDX9_9PLAT|nr:unnamed protein product [Protopolystoma xenopodis]
MKLFVLSLPVSRYPTTGSKHDLRYEAEMPWLGANNSNLPEVPTTYRDKNESGDWYIYSTMLHYSRCYRVS